METIGNHEPCPHPYYSRASHCTSTVALMMAFFAVQGGLVMGGLVSLVANGIVVWIATIFGLVAGVVAYSFCHISSRTFRLEDDILTVAQPRVDVTEPQEA